MVSCDLFRVMRCDRLTNVFPFLVMIKKPILKLKYVVKNYLTYDRNKTCIFDFLELLFLETNLVLQKLIFREILLTMHIVFF